ncbi:MAG: PIN domain-containing protein [Polyangia bacterium]
MAGFAYVDTSAVVALAFAEPRAIAVRDRLGEVDQLFSSTLLEAELLAAAEREGRRSGARRFLDPIRLFAPERRLTEELETVLDHGYVRGADLHHLATALHLFGDPGSVAFLTLDARQGELARALGFETLE